MPNKHQPADFTPILLRRRTRHAYKNPSPPETKPQPTCPLISYWQEYLKALKQTKLTDLKPTTPTKQE